MKENKEETRLPHGSKCIIQDESIPFIGEPQLRSAEEILNGHLGSLLDPIPSGTLYGITNAMEDYASQFKSVQKEAFTLEDMAEAFSAGYKRNHWENTLAWEKQPEFDEWIKTRKEES